jgi:CBS-domain-containing membrane protein
LDVLGEIGKKKVTELQSNLGGVSGKVGLIQSVYEDEKIGKAFKMIDDYNIHGVPVLNRKDQLVGNVSVTDMKVKCKFSLFIHLLFAVHP